MSHEPTASESPPPQPESKEPPHDPYAAYAQPHDPYAGYYVVGYHPMHEEKRLHPATIVVQVAKFLRSFGVLVAIAIAARLAGRSADTLEIIATLGGAFSIAAAVLRYISFRYGVRDGALHITSGIIQRQNRTIPIERIQNINIRQPLLHRMLGVVDLRIETASGGEAEAELSVVSMADAEAVRAALAAPREAVSQAAPVASDVVYRASLKHLILAGATQNRLGTLVAAVIGFLFWMNSFQFDNSKQFGRWVRQVTDHPHLPGWAAILGIAIGLLAIGWLASIVLTVVGRYGFELTRSSGQLHRTFGLLTRHQSVFPVQRVQVLRIAAPLFQRWFGLCRISAETAGSFRENERNDQGSNELCPILERRNADAMCRLVIDDFALDGVELESIHPLGRRRALIRMALFLVIAIGLASWLWKWKALWALLAVLPAAWAYAWLYFRSVGFAIAGRYFVVKHGIWTRVLEVVPLEKVQASFVRQSPLQRRLGLASFEVLTAGSAFGRSVAVTDVAYERAVELQDYPHAVEHRIIAEISVHSPEKMGMEGDPEAAQTAQLPADSAWTP